MYVWPPDSAKPVLDGLEPSTLRLTAARSSQLSYKTLLLCHLCEAPTIHIQKATVPIGIEPMTCRLLKCIHNSRTLYLLSYGTMTAVYADSNLHAIYISSNTIDLSIPSSKKWCKISWIVQFAKQLQKQPLASQKIFKNKID